MSSPRLIFVELYEKDLQRVDHYDTSTQKTGLVAKLDGLIVLSRLDHNSPTVAQMTPVSKIGNVPFGVVP